MAREKILAKNQANRVTKTLNKWIEEGLLLTKLDYYGFCHLFKKCKCVGEEFVEYLPDDIYEAWDRALRRWKACRPKTNQRIVPNCEKTVIPEVVERHTEEELDSLFNRLGKCDLSIPERKWY
ncbi:MAG: hypothetical protein VKL60_00355 [Sphaerospermopsis sp.]|nr:hypothetical protein [Sphaerospermopsis sp.]